LPWM